MQHNKWCKNHQKLLITTIRAKFHLVQTYVMLQSTSTATSEITHHIWSLIFLPPNSTVLILKSIPVIHKITNKYHVILWRNAVDKEEQVHTDVTVSCTPDKCIHVQINTQKTSNYKSTQSTMPQQKRVTQQLLQGTTHNKSPPNNITFLSHLYRSETNKN